MPRSPSKLYADKLRQIQLAIDAIEGGGAYTIGTTVYSSASQLESLYEQHDLYSVKAAIQAIEEGGQSYQHGDKQYTRADLQKLYDRLDRLEGRATTKARGGSRVRRIVPIG